MCLMFSDDGSGFLALCKMLYLLNVAFRYLCELSGRKYVFIETIILQLAYMRSENSLLSVVNLRRYTSVTIMEFVCSGIGTLYQTN